MLDKLLKNVIFLTISISVIVFGVILGFTSVFYNLDRTLGEEIYNARTNYKRVLSRDIALVKIDEKTTDSLGRFPFSRDVYIPVIEKLKEAGAIVIGFDVIFADKTNEKIDNEFAKSIKEAGNVVLGGAIIKSKNNKMVFEYPLDILYKNVLTVGYFQPVYDKINQKVYSIDPEKKLGNKNYNHFSVSLLKAYYSKIYDNKGFLSYNNIYKKGDSFFNITPNFKVPYDNRGNKNLGINFLPRDRIPSFSFIDIKNDNFNKSFIKDKIIVIGATAKGIKDTFITNDGVRYGVETHLNMVNTILKNDFKVYFPKYLEYILIYFLILLSVYFNLSMRGKGLLISNISIIGIFTLIILFIITKYGYILNFTSQFFFAVIITLTISNILKSFMEDKNKTLLNKALGQYVSKDIAEEILYGEGKINLDGERKNISIFFSDIEGFTSISEKMNPEELVIFLREYLGAMSNIIMDEKGLIDKYEGDAIMALWGVFGHENESSYNNCYSAILQQKKLKELNVGWKKRFGEELKIRMGINTGEAIVGNIGATGRKMEFTALGDSVNLASRLEEVNKKYGTYLCVSEVVYVDQKENFDFRYLDQIRVKGKTIPVKIFELISIKGEIDETKKDIVEKFEKAIKLYLDRKFKEALDVFNSLSLLGDNPSKTYIGRCKIFIENEPEENWDGVWTMKTK